MLWQLVTLAALAAGAAGHGRVLEPPSRASKWRFGFRSAPNYDDDGLNCGGFFHQYAVNGGKCGICGDPYDMREPRDHELGGRWGSGQIVAHYNQGQVFPATVEISAYHRGYWEFRICPDPSTNRQDCFDKYLLELEDGGTKYYPWKDATYSANYRLPKGLTCDHCVLQWRYTAGNNWGTCANGTEGLGCGNQETFGACSDISIGPARDATAPTPLPLCIDRSVKGILELIYKIAVRPRQAPIRLTPTVHQRKNNRWKERKKKKPRKKKKDFFNSPFKFYARQ